MEEEKFEEKKKYKSKNSLGVRIMAGFLAFLMVLSVTATVISCLLV